MNGASHAARARAERTRRSGRLDDSRSCSEEYLSPPTASPAVQRPPSGNGRIMRRMLVDRRDLDALIDRSRERHD
jgi:hypothetical protein